MNLSDIPAAMASSHSQAEDEYNWAEHAQGIAAERGQVVVLPLPNQLQLDLDSHEALQVCFQRCNDFGIQSPWVAMEPSKTPGHYHVTITFPARVFTEAERIAYQFALGSDPVRERLNMMRLHAGYPNPSRLFKTPKPSNA